jgi:RimJ/RimL family protein N-acetyltransferase
MAPIDPVLLAERVRTAELRFRTFTDDLASKPTKPGEWTSKELLGHLIDSAVNNHQRVVRAQIAAHLDTTGKLEFPHYEQEEWVRVGAYAERPWAGLIDLWVAINLQLVQVLERFDPAALSVPLSINGGEPVPISGALDYLEHLDMHLTDFPHGSVFETLRTLPTELRVGELLLRTPIPSDAPALIVECQDPEIPRWTTVPSPFGQTEADSFINREIDRVAVNDLRRNYLIFRNETELVGMVGLVRVRPEDEAGEVGWWMAAHARGQGILHRSLQAVLRLVLEAGYQRVDAEILVGNNASQRVAERAGFAHEGVLRSIGNHGCGENLKRIDVHVYSLLPSDPAAVALTSF